MTIVIQKIEAKSITRVKKKKGKKKNSKARLDYLFGSNL